MSGYRDEAYVQTRRRVLEQARVGAALVVSRAVLEDRPDVGVDQLVRRLTSYVLREHLADDVYEAAAAVEWPRSTWQMFKATHEASWWLGWLVRRHPVDMHRETRRLTVEVGRYATYPESTITHRGLGPMVIQEVVREDLS